MLDRAFGADRRSRTAYRIRAGAEPVAAISLALVDGATLIGALQCWPVALHRDDGGRVPLVMVGPVAIAPPHQGHGHGTTLMLAMLERVRALGLAEPLMLIGDPEYYARFGFTADATREWRVPGPVERHRLLAHGAVPAGAGILGPRG
ncbi:GNAT family N-acetyltransferase [Sphingomonas sp.]|uniref:GNAT family N-acetyltransferase n=1 Tax=Sphingomonas sp. TaxID=28214 RepID=UPI0035A95AC3